jgi:transcriptional regulator with XRE-family HTH domain
MVVAMAVSDLPSVGVRIREERLRRGISLRALARDVGVSASMISQIETGKSRPSVSTLYAITSALGMSIEEVFTSGEQDEDDQPAPPQVTVASADQGVAVLAAPETRRRHRELGPLVHPDERQVLRLDSGVTWERLGELHDRSVDFLLITYAPGASSSSRSELMRHRGAEYGYLLRGELVLTLGFEEVHLRPGDAISFDSKTPHGYRNDGTEPAVGVWFVLED